MFGSQLNYHTMLFVIMSCPTLPDVVTMVVIVIQCKVLYTHIKIYVTKQ